MEERKTVKLYIFDTCELCDPFVFGKYFEELSAERKLKANSFIRESDKKLCLGAGILLDAELRSRGLSEKETKIKYSRYGKPYFEELPSLHFSISHSKDIVAVTFSDLEVGCDIEYIKKGYEETAKRFFSREEYLAIEKAKTEHEKTVLFFRIWTLKESFMKVTGMGFHLSPSDFTVSAENGISVKQSFDREKYFFREFDVKEGYACSVCAKEELSSAAVIKYKIT